MEAPEVRVVRLEKPLDAATAEYLCSFAPPEKQARWRRMKPGLHTDTMLLGAALTALLLRMEFGIALEEQVFSYGSYGKPSLIHFPSVWLSISHSGPYAACGIFDRPVGVDIQVIGSYRAAVAHRVCTAAELAKIETSPNPAAAFTMFWTRKEAYGKMLGVGLGKGFPQGTKNTRTFALADAFLSVCTGTENEVMK